MEYKILKDASVEGLSKKVNTMLMLMVLDGVREGSGMGLGWRPMGDLVVALNPNKGTRFVQAMVRD